MSIKNHEHCSNRWDNELCNDLECEECNNWKEEEYITKYKNKRFYLIVDGWHEEILLEDRLGKRDTYDYSNVEEGLECAMKDADFLNDLDQQSQDIEDNFCGVILTLLEKNFRLKHTQDGLVLGNVYDDKINVLEELLHETGYEHLIVDFYERIAEEAME